MAAEDALRSGTASEETLRQLAQRVEALDGIPERVQALEEVQHGDGAAVPSQFTINKAGEVSQTTVENNFFEEPGVSKAVKYKGRILKTNPVTGVLEWVEPGGANLAQGGVKCEWGAEGFSSEAVEVNSGLATAKWMGHQIIGVLEKVEHAGCVFYIERLALLGGKTSFRAWSSVKQAKESYVNLHWLALG